MRCLIIVLISINQMIVDSIQPEAVLKTTEAIKIKAYGNKQELLNKLNEASQQIIDTVLMVRIMWSNIIKVQQAVQQNKTTLSIMENCDSYKKTQKKITEIKSDHQKIYEDIANVTENIIKESIYICKKSAHIRSRVATPCDNDPSPHFESRFKPYFTMVDNYTLNIKYVKDILFNTTSDCLNTFKSQTDSAADIFNRDTLFKMFITAYILLIYIFN